MFANTMLSAFLSVAFQTNLVLIIKKLEKWNTIIFKKAK